MRQLQQQLLEHNLKPLIKESETLLTAYQNKAGLFFREAASRVEGWETDCSTEKPTEKLAVS
ncbi:MAG: hypothetical protein ACD_42C00404G0002 [uncultured bacterium]|nr:MAG: hypothetical protein ACD_42C00404G0002 [uncultured bacterium]OGT32859.1 MAG: hypothetical protein A3C44_04800 [Gammaproteobacteria bacterium RIFCSPHIGHO2_02_FULL_39_13]OGT50517.1 MAG: hypothetical protein A3E53_03240 [Gammaproteobacteria bacterium RIFCSPHIGHO2_12_FULL_39_24]